MAKKVKSHVSFLSLYLLTIHAQFTQSYISINPSLENRVLNGNREQFQIKIDVDEESQEETDEKLLSGNENNAQIPNTLKRRIRSLSSQFKPSKTMYTFNDSHYYAKVHWSGSNSSTILVLMSHPKSMSSSEKPSYFYVSRDYGKTFENRTNDFILPNKTHAVVTDFFSSSKDNKRYIFVSKYHKYIFQTNDEWNTFTRVAVPFIPVEAKYHPNRPYYVMAWEKDEGNGMLYASTNNGKSWSFKAARVKNYYWGWLPPFDTGSTLYFQREGWFGAGGYVQKATPWRPIFSFTETVAYNVLDFKLIDQYMFAVKNGSDQRYRRLQVSVNRRPFQNTSFPFNNATSYIVVDASENETMIAVSHDNWANLYISNRQALRYSLSLTNLVYYNEGDGVKHKFFEHNFVDMHKVDGISGIYLATCQRHKELHSFITFDKGGEWSPLRPPPGTVCNTTECYLHVSQEFGYHSPFTRYTPIYSKKSAPGFILATGNVGDSMNGYPNVYFSRDAGLNWKQLFTGHFYYGFVDHGGVIVVVPKYGLVDELRYSYNEGNTWNTYQFTDKPMKVYGLLTEPGEKTTIFTLFGSKPRQHSWIIIQVDMRNVLGSPCKADSDYKLWEVTDTRNDTQHCLLGKKQVYERRDPNSRCFNGYNYDRPKLALPCLCTRDDYMCDFGYSLASWRGWFLRTCSPDQDYIITDSKPPDWCRPGLTYNVTKGYRIVPGDECVDGVKKYYDPKIYTCPIKNITDYVFYSTRTALHRYDMLLKQSVEFNLGDMENVISIDVDYKSNVLFFADIFYDEIVMMNLNSGKVTTLLKQNNSQVHIEGLAFDWYTHNLYYCDGGLAEIAIINVDGKHRKRLIGPSSLQKPRALIVHPAAGTMYWTDWGNNAQIGKANMDGSGVTTLINHNIRWPNGITIDFGSGRLFWTDAGHDRIESCDLNGRNRKVLATETPHPYAVSIYKNTLIWDDWQKHAVYKMSKRGDSEPEEVVSDVTNAMDLKAYWPDKQKEGRNTCEGKCSVICLLKGKDDYTCTCPDNLLDDGKEGCKCPDGQKYEDGECKTEGACLANQFKCKSGECIPLSWQCDEDSDCDDGSDETEDVCHGQGCNREQLTCDNGRCLSKTWKCDGDNDCGDGSDERNCDTECEKDGKHVRCPNKRCISKTWLCDGDNDCSDYWDERNCRNYTTLPPFTQPPTPGKCPSSQFACKNGYCISDEMRCDRVNNCGDNSDEQDCHVTDRPFTRPPIPLTCPQGWAFCADRSMCFNKADKCDTFPDCRDGSDEVGCPKECKEFECGSGECIPDSKVCDGNQDCKNGDDEKTCNKKPTEWCFPFPWGFNCTRPDGHCYLHDQMCDGKVQCEDYSDEDKNVCGVTDRVKELKWEVEGTSVILKWKHANVMLGDADGYFIAYIEETGKRAEVSIDLVDTYTVKNLRACRTYYFAVALRHKKLPKSKWLFTSSNGIETEGRGEPQGAYDIRVSQPSVSWNEDGGRCFNDYEVNTRWVICEQGNQTIILYNVGPVLHDVDTLLIERGGVKDKVYTCHIIVSYETYGQSDVNKTSLPFKFQLGRTSDAPDHGKRTDNKDKKKANALVWAIPVAVVVLALFAMLVVMLVKYRRLQHSFLAFAARGSYVRQDDDFDEDDPGNMVVGFHAGEDAPMINRFSDDEPLVVG